MSDPAISQAGTTDRAGRPRIVLITIAAVFMLALLSAGLVGARWSRTQAKVDEIIHLRDKLRQQTDERFLATVPNVEPASIRQSTDRPTVEALKTAIERFELQHRPADLRQKLELRIAKGAVANFERKFSETLGLLMDHEETPAWAGFDLLQLRADALYGVGRREEALDLYRTMVVMAPDRLDGIGHLGSCEAALGKDSTESYRRLGEGFLKQGDRLVSEGKAAAAVEKYQRSLEIESWLTQKTGQQRSAFAAVLDARGAALLLDGKLAAAAADFEEAAKSCEMLSEPEKGRRLTKLLEHRGDTYLALGNAGAAIEQYDRALAQGGEKSLSMQNNRANALLALRKLDAARASYTEAINMHAAQGGGPNELAISLNNRGVTHFARGNVDLALVDFRNAIETLRSKQSEERIRANSDSARPNVQLEVAVGYWNNSLEFVPRSRMAGRSSRLSAALGMALKNQAAARLVKGDAIAALEDLREAAEVYRRLVEDEEERDLHLPFAKTLNVAAWIYATALEDGLRNPIRGKALASKACELTEWKVFTMIETLAAACAGTGEFNEAVTWQQRALALAPEKQRRDCEARLELYKSGKPYRVPVR